VKLPNKSLHPILPAAKRVSSNVMFQINENRKESGLTNIALIGFDLDIIDLIETNPLFNLYGFIDVRDVSKDLNINDVPYLGSDEDWNEIRKNKSSLKLAIAMDVPKIRKKVYDKYDKTCIVSVESPLSHISKRASVGKGCIIQHGVKVMPYSKIGKGCSLNVNSTIHHESILGDFSILAPGALVLGRAKIGVQVYIGAGAIIKQNCTIGSNSTIGAGAVVVNDIPQNSVVVGVPANRFL